MSSRPAGASLQVVSGAHCVKKHSSGSTSHVAGSTPQGLCAMSAATTLHLPRSCFLSHPPSPMTPCKLTCASTTMITMSAATAAARERSTPMRSTTSPLSRMPAVSAVRKSQGWLCLSAGCSWLSWELSVGRGLGASRQESMQAVLFFCFWCCSWARGWHGGFLGKQCECDLHRAFA